MNKYLIISTVGDNSFHLEWIKQEPNFDLVLIYYGNNKQILNDYTKHTPYVYAAKGEKYHLLKSFLLLEPKFISQYQYIWLPDDDISISTDNINRMFEIANNYKLSLAQPAMVGYISHKITSPEPNILLRYTNFVEVIAPLMSLDTLMLVRDTFDKNYSAWGYDALWPYLLGYPKDKIAIIDNVIMEHTKPVGLDYSRFPENPIIESQNILNTLPKTDNLKHTQYSKLILENN